MNQPEWVTWSKYHVLHCEHCGHEENVCPSSSNTEQPSEKSRYLEFLERHSQCAKPPTRKMATSLSAREQIAAQILCGLIHKLEEPYSGTIYVTEPSDSEQHDHDPPSATSLMPTIRVWPQSAYLAELAIEYADALLKAMEREA